MYNDFLKAIRTSAEARSFLGELELLEKATFATESEQFDTVIQGQIRPEMAAIFKKLGREAISTVGFLAGLRQAILNSRKAELVIAVSPNQRLTLRLSEWVKENFGQDVLLDLLYDPGILGGAIVSFGGKYMDFSLRPQVAEWFSKNKI